ncbi:MAG: hypothetical protein E6R03_17650 [Hyphomicrobiaceae bacterium]|nr:MAG: hypothetical protein E6R03_17650 [Hyphomicrobiaceae bacterium]
MASSVKVRLPDIAGKARKLKDDSERILAQEIEIARGEIDARTQAGLDVENNPFKPYSPFYKAEREQRGYSTEVNLTVTGTMLRSMTSRVEAIANGLAGVIFFISGRPDGESNAEIARKHNEGDYGTGRKKVRKFFALSEKQIREIISNVRKGIRL